MKRSFQPYTRPKDRIERSWLTNFYHRQTSAMRSSTEMFWNEFTGMFRFQKRYVEREWNKPLIVATLILFVVGAPSLFVWHRLQITRQAEALLTKSRDLEDQERYKDAAEYCLRYLRLRPANADARVHLAEMYNEGAQTFPQFQRAVSLLREATGISPESASLKRNLAKRYIDLHNYPEAVEQADDLIQLEPEDPEGWAIKAVGEYRQASEKGGRVSMQKVRQTYIQAVSVNPDDAKLALDLADIYRKGLEGEFDANRRGMLADETMNRLVTNNPESTNALLARYEYRVKYELPDSDGDLDQALRVAPDDANVLLTASDRAMRRREFSDAVRYGQRVIEKAPADFRGHLALGFALAADKRLEDALDIWRKGADQTRAMWRPQSVRPEQTVIMLYLAINLADLLIKTNRLDEADERLGILERGLYLNVRELAAPFPDEFRAKTKFVRGLYHAARGDYYKAVPELRQVLVAFDVLDKKEEDISRMVAVQYELARCYAAQNQYDLAAATYEHAIELQRVNARHYLAAGVAYELAGQPEKAILKYNTGLQQTDPPPELWVALARAQMSVQRAISGEGVQWKTFEGAMREAQKLNASTSELAVLEAESLATRGDRAGALKRLHEALAADTSSPLLWQTVVLAEQLWGDPAQADAKLKEYEDLIGSTMDSQLLRVAVLTKRNDIPGARAALQTAIERAPEAERPKLLFQMGELSLQDDDITAARTQLREIVDSAPANLQLMRLLGELALSANDLDDAQRWEDRLREMERGDGTTWRYIRARRLIEQSTSTSDPEFVEAIQLQETIATTRPTWPQGILLRGYIEERRGKKRNAISAYKQAIDLGENNFKLIEKLISLMYEDGQVTEADRYLSRLGQEGSFSTDITQVAISVSLKHNQLAQARQLAEKAVERAPEDPRALVWLGQTLLLSEDYEQARQVLEKAVSHAEQNDIRPWMALISFYARRKQVPEAEDALGRMREALPGLGEGRREFVFAQAYQLIGEIGGLDDPARVNRYLNEADAHYRRALEAAPTDISVQQKGAAFFNLRDPNVAEKALRQVLALEPQSDMRRRLAMLLARKGGEQNWKEALELLAEQDRNKRVMNAADVRARAIVLLENGGLHHRRQALQLLEELVETERDVRDEDRVLLARLYEQDHLIKRAREQYITLVTRADPRPEFIATLVDLLLREGEPKEAESWLDRFQSMQPDSLDGLALRARWLHAMQRDREIDSLVEPYVEARMEQAKDDQDRGEWCKRAAELYRQVDDPEATERWFRKGQAFSTSVFQPYAMWLSDRGRVSDAVQICLEANQLDPTAAPAMVVGLIMTKAKAKEAEFARAEQILVDAVASRPKNLLLKLTLGVLRVMQSRNDDAIKLYREVLEVDPENVLALNNLALALSEDPATHEEALDAIVRAIRRAGPIEALEDTHAMVLLAQGRVESALKILEPFAESNSASSMNAVRYMHLAFAHQQNSSLEEARWAMQQARDRNLADEVLTPREQQMLDRLDAALAR